MFNRNFFGQVLEGERVAVSALFCKIASDLRHASIVLIGAEDVHVRLFERWSMGFADCTDTVARLNVKYGLGDQFDPTLIKFDRFADYVLDMVSLKEKSMISVLVLTDASLSYYIME